MLSKNFDSYRSLQQRFCIHIEDLKFFDISVYFHKQRYYQTVLETFYRHQKVNLNCDVQYIFTSDPHAAIQTDSPTEQSHHRLQPVCPFHRSLPTDRMPSQTFAYWENT